MCVSKVYNVHKISFLPINYYHIQSHINLDKYNNNYYINQGLIDPKVEEGM